MMFGDFEVGGENEMRVKLVFRPTLPLWTNINRRRITTCDFSNETTQYLKMHPIAELVQFIFIFNFLENSQSFR